MFSNLSLVVAEMGEEGKEEVGRECNALTEINTVSGVVVKFFFTRAQGDLPKHVNREEYWTRSDIFCACMVRNLHG